MKIALGMSGGVDSSLSAALLREQGHEVTGVFLECWRAPGCRAEEDRKDALAVALQLGIPFEVLDFKDEYKQRVVEYFFDEYKAGRTPNPDVMCNKEIKFGMFYDWAMARGFDAVATGHYAQITEVDGKKFLTRSADEHKDQTYFLYLLRQEQLEHIVFPIGHLKKSQVREEAKKRGLAVAAKPDSQGICFIGEINVHNFLKERLGENPGEVVNTAGEVIGAHKGLWFYTIGQRHGFELKGKIRQDNGEWKHVIPPFYVIGKNAEKNQLIVGFGEEAMRNEFQIENTHWIGDAPASENLSVRIRHGGQLFSAILKLDTKRKNRYTVRINEKILGIADGQSAVIYSNTHCLGGGIVCHYVTQHLKQMKSHNL
ncbi:MAG TPA: tRNA 2-thiouridine(34) synthase MnmA [Candidatus Saccharimonadia bacterium]|nr:tRNA 2-thiouridine(34) synthase MnmA [Candidatus Saccharimonadia bacterium]